ncbi:MAG TPA: trehalose-phosphatase [Pseudolabrys sp.]|jgi:trehalose 6-phosphate phosphatase|nr:trehalose-phosphatase [Pseudolabrys sp.]
MQRDLHDTMTNNLATSDLGTVALLLDVDGTLIDIGETPADVDVPADLLASLKRLIELTGGAVALVSGRPIADLDRLFAPLRLPAIGGHGAEMRVNGEQARHNAQPLPAALRERLADLAKLAPGIIIEDKGYSLALHYRAAPQEKERLSRHIAQGVAAFPEEPVEVLPGKAMLEVKRPSVSKGEGVRELMKHPPFRERKPIFIGDDVTDESVFAVLPALGGEGFSVGREFHDLAGIFASPSEVRRTLQRLAENGGRSPPEKRA